MDTPVYKDASCSVDERVADLLSRMSLEEKAAQVAVPFGTVVDVHNPPKEGWGMTVAALSTLDLPPREAAVKANELQRKHIEETRLGIPIILGEEGLIGLKVRDATTFPDSIAQAATWDPTLIERMGSVIGSQMGLIGVRQVLSPLADVACDPRWGRIEETYGEEPYLVGSMATAFVKGVQGERRSIPVMATLKHFLGYGASMGGRNTDFVEMGPRELHERIGLPFEMAIRLGGVRGIMPTYNAIDGDPVTGSQRLLRKLLRKAYGFGGLIISDLGAVGHLASVQGTASNEADALGQAIRAGVNLDLDNKDVTKDIVKAVGSGELDEKDLDAVVSQTLRVKFDLGLFEHPYVDVDKVPDTLDSPKERKLARTVAQESVVLLKNDKVKGARLLPLRKDLRSIAVIGPNADRPLGQLGDYSYQVLDSQTRRFNLAADPQARFEAGIELSDGNGPDDATLLVHSVPVVTFLQGIRNHVGKDTEVHYEKGCDIGGDDRSHIDDAVTIAQNADVAVVVLGDQSGIGQYGSVGEGIDSTSCELPGVQRELVEAIAKTGTPTVVVLSHGRPYALDWMTKCVPAMLTMFFGGEEAGDAMADVLFGDVNPAGRLPIALLKDIGAAPLPYWRTGQFNPYVDGSVDAVFPFGHGLSYADFLYGGLHVDARRVPTDGVIGLDFEVTNTGACDGDEVVQIYGRDVVASMARPAMKLMAFSRRRIAAGETKKMHADIPAELFALWDEDDGWVVEQGTVKLFIGASSADIRLTADVELDGDDHVCSVDRALFSQISVVDA